MAEVSNETLYAILQRVEKKVDKTNGNVLKNTNFRLETVGALKLMKFILTFIGFGTVANILLLIFK